MGVFDDDKLGELDWMTQMTETIDSELNAVLAKLPDRIPVTASLIWETSSNSYLSFDVSDVVRGLLSKAILRGRLSWEEERILVACFEFELNGTPEFDLRSGILTGEIFVVKKVQTLSDEDLLPLMGKKGIEAFGRASDYSSDAPIERLNEILDILGGCSEAMKNRSGRKKASAIRNRLSIIFSTNEWRIRDATLADKVGLWIKGYVSNGNLADLTNLCKLKVMTHNNMPIYSVKEET